MVLFHELDEEKQRLVMSRRKIETRIRGGILQDTRLACLMMAMICLHEAGGHYLQYNRINWPHSITPAPGCMKELDENTRVIVVDQEDSVEGWSFGSENVGTRGTRAPEPF